MAQEATTTVPRVLMPTCSSTFDSPYMELCTPEGMPMRSIFLSRDLSPFSPSRSRKGPFRVRSLTVTSPVATAWETRVATATPTTPQEKAMTKSTSRTMLSPQLTTRQRKGKRASPMARSIPEPMLNRSRKTAPRKKMR